MLVAIGANLPGPDGASALETCRRAARLLDGICGLHLVALSRWWESAPIPPAPGMPPYVNGVALLAGEAVPEAVLNALHAIEDRFGRVRPFANAPRTLDLDLIDAGGRVLDGPGLVLPHPRAHLRAFVLRPLAEVSPGWVHPRSGLPVGALLDKVAAQDARPLSPEGD
ncbi:2-amino-4-hydroxy-6-hydroxymethyldihydropteridine diphosphokinase [Plastoroseomonas arctica]|uniref:2-amino-4-hydroxy-6-hydroxymethyldihydropteridine pyrophosphokinase n=1 Tax=Plastoroseomonas arctica TaxID=1509237 RepID=A0AAF1JY76_9PROT|nr:2-amino-4-hydroxy-6-hydroxymethyldihydropteridine diphosphokinase [Plastoroseomonas arctica]MBR0656719.1 2-amino-4-hydroxy-6-hydroxymethyldihydropteridine diphosphokinase [Plastoroseomonas arctica]